MSEETLAARIRRLREARGMSRRDLAVAMRAFGARTDPPDIGRYEGDYYEPKLRTFVALARALGVSLDVLYFGEEGAPTEARAGTERRAGDS